MSRVPSVLSALSLAWLVFIGLSCGDEACQGNEPTAIFQPDIPGVLSHSFLINKGGDALETLKLSDGFSLELWQSNCRSTEQEFRFALPLSEKINPQKISSDQVIELAAAQFHRLSLLGPAYRAFDAWAQTISAHKESFQPGRPLEVQPGITITIDGIPSSEKFTILVRLEQQKN